MEANRIEQKVVPKHAFVAVPVYGNMDVHFVNSLLRFHGDQAIKHNITLDFQLGDSLVNRARNSLTRRFLESHCTHLLFIDSDLVFSTEQVNKILDHDVDIVAGVYCKKQEGPVQVVCNANKNVMEAGPDGLCEVKYVGTGFMCISRRVFEVMIEKWGEEMWYLLDPEHKVKEYDFWHVGAYDFGEGVTPRRRFLSEDWWFCQKAIDAGLKIFLDLSVILKHSGNALYPLSYQEKTLLERHTRPAPTGASDTVTASSPVESVPVASLSAERAEAFTVCDQK